MLSKTPLVISFITVIMDVTQTTTTKVIARTSKSSDPLCRLCDKNINGKHLLRIYSVSGKEKGLELKILHTCGIHTQENDYLPKVISRVCAGFIEKIWNFQNLCQKNQVELRQNISIKRVSKFHQALLNHLEKDKHFVLQKGQLKNIFNLMWFHYKI